MRPVDSRQRSSSESILPERSSRFFGSCRTRKSDPKSNVPPQDWITISPALGIRKRVTHPETRCYAGEVGHGEQRDFGDGSQRDRKETSGCLRVRVCVNGMLTAPENSNSLGELAGALAPRRRRRGRPESLTGSGRSSPPHQRCFRMLLSHGAARNGRFRAPPDRNERVRGADRNVRNRMTSILLKTLRYLASSAR